jgi:hypothetical protein
LFSKIHQANIEWEQLGDLSNIAINWHFSKNIENYHWIPQEIRTNWIEKIPFRDIFQREFVFTLENRTFHIHLWFPIFSMSEKKIQEKVYSTIMKIYMWLHVSKNYLDNNTITCSKTVHIYLFLTEHVKFLPSYLGSSKSKEKDTVMIDEIHANTAFTTGCTQEKTNIFVYREEEWFKVLIHETFHNLGLDFIDIDKPEINTKIRNIFPVSVTDIRSYETYTEMWAEILNMLFVVYFLDFPRKKGRLPINRWIHTLASFYKIQLSFS